MTGVDGDADVSRGTLRLVEQLPRPSVRLSPPRPVSDEQLRELLAARMGERARAMILLAAFAGLRVHEIAKIQGDDIDPAAGTLRVTSNRGKTRRLRLNVRLVDLAASMPRAGYWFPATSTRPGEHLLNGTVSRIIQRAMKRAGIADGTARRLRDWYATTLRTDWTELRAVRELMGKVPLPNAVVYPLAPRDLPT